jgi:two-component system sensor histidine kinase VicK
VSTLHINFESYFKTAPPTIILYPDIPKFTIVTANQAYLDATQAKLEDIVGQGFLDAFPENPLDSVSKNVQALRNSITQAVLTKKEHVLPSQKYDIPIWGTDRFNTHYWKATNSPVVNDDGEVEYIVHVTLDITSAVEVAQKERFAFEVADAKRKANLQMEERLRLAIDSANLGTWHIDAVTRNLTASYRLKEFFGFHPDDKMDMADAINQVRKDFRYRVNEAIEKAITEAAPFDMEYPVVGYRDGKERWVRATGKLYEAEAGRPANFSGTIMDITERKLDEMRKNDFIAMVSHELKTPLTSAKAHVQMLIAKAQKSGDTFTSASLNKVHQQVEKMHTLIKGFLDVARLEEGKIHLNVQDFVLSDLLQEAVEDVKALTQNHEFILDICGPLTVKGDRDKIVQVVNNFLSNAIKYSPKSTSIWVTCNKKDGTAIVSVKDEGFGIQPQDKDKLFDRFYRVESKQTQTIAGFGIGLYLCAEIVQRHNGKIWVDSEPEQGSTFSFSLPLT